MPTSHEYVEILVALSNTRPTFTSRALVARAPIQTKHEYDDPLRGLHSRRQEVSRKAYRTTRIEVVDRGPSRLAKAVRQKPFDRSRLAKAIRQAPFGRSNQGATRPKCDGGTQGDRRLKTRQNKPRARPHRRTYATANAGANGWARPGNRGRPQRGRSPNY